MAIVIGDITPKLDTGSTTDTNSYTTANVTLDPDNLYILVFSGNLKVGGSASNAKGTPTQAGVDWEVVARQSRDDYIAINVYKAEVLSQQSATIDLDFPATQENCYWQLYEIADAAYALVQADSSSSANTNAPSITLANPAAAGNLLMSFFSCRLSTDWTTGSNETALSGITGKVLYSQYNLLADNVLDAGTSVWGNRTWVGIEIVEASAATVAISTVNGGNAIADGETGVTIVVTDGVASGYTVTISPSTDINDINAATQSSVSNESTTSLDITVELPAGSSSAEPVYVFVNDGTNTTDAFSVSVTPIDTTVITLFLTHNGLDTGTPVICESTDFANGLSVSVYRSATLAVEEPATPLVSLSGENTATPQFTATFPNGDPVSGDGIKYTYDAAVGDIKAGTGGQPLTGFTEKDGTNCA